MGLLLDPHLKFTGAGTESGTKMLAESVPAHKEPDSSLDAMACGGEKSLAEGELLMTEARQTALEDAPTCNP